MNRFYSCPLASGSSGNCCYIEYNSSTRILLDLGLSLKMLKSLLNSIVDADVDQIDAVLITHEHVDHIKGLAALAKKFPDLPFYIHEQSYYAAPDDTKVAIRRNVRFFDTGVTFKIGDVAVSPFRTSHDSVYSVGYTFAGEDGVKEIGFATDLGLVTKEVGASLSGCRRVYIESNYDIDMLRLGRYPVSIQRRIMSGSGHLSNSDCSAFLPYLVRSGTEHIMLCHLSEENNTHSLAFNAAKDSIENAGLLHFVRSLAIAPKKAVLVREGVIPVVKN